jgi:hypothetical protein
MVLVRHDLDEQQIRSVNWRWWSKFLLGLGGQILTSMVEVGG